MLAPRPTPTHRSRHDSNLPQYEKAFVDGGAAGAMCSYFAPNGVSSCGNKWLLNGMVREQWARPDAVIMSGTRVLGS